MNFSRVDFTEANLSGADFSEADLSGAFFVRADITGAKFVWANLSGADFKGARSKGSDFGYANLQRTHFYGADLEGSRFRSADLYMSDFNGANIKGADFKGSAVESAHFCGAAVGTAKNLPHIPMTCPERGAFVGWKNVNGHIIELLIPEHALRSSAAGRKCRCSEARVIGITNSTGKKRFSEVVNYAYGSGTVYRVGETVYPDSFDGNRWNECSHGIHFFMERSEAINYYN